LVEWPELQFTHMELARGAKGVAVPFACCPDAPHPAAARDFSESSVAAQDFSEACLYIEGVT